MASWSDPTWNYQSSRMTSLRFFAYMSKDRRPLYGKAARLTTYSRREPFHWFMVNPQPHLTHDALVIGKTCYFRSATFPLFFSSSSALLIPLLSIPLPRLPIALKQLTYVSISESRWLQDGVDMRTAAWKSLCISIFIIIINTLSFIDNNSFMKVSVILSSTILYLMIMISPLRIRLQSYGRFWRQNRPFSASISQVLRPFM
jgi:hypothetical protein